MTNDKWKMKNGYGSRVLRLSFVVLWVAGFIWAASAQSTQELPTAPPAQPLPFSHRVHAGSLGLKCEQCHPNPNPGERMHTVAAGACMPCHATVGPDSPAIRKLAAFARSRRDLRWARIYEIPASVLFSHREHIAAGNTCAECHGPVTERDQLYREVDLSMGGCINCHVAKKASIDCTYCHEQ
jgi:hypothetical protein